MNLVNLNLLGVCLVANGAFAGNGENVALL